MNDIKDELQYIIFRDEPAGRTSHLKKIQVFLRTYAKTGKSAKNQQRFKSKETAALVNFAQKEKLFYEREISENDFIAAGAEQLVYRFDNTHVIKTNGSIFYEYWLDYFNSLFRNGTFLN